MNPVSAQSGTPEPAPPYGDQASVPRAARTADLPSVAAASRPSNPATAGVIPRYGEPPIVDVGLSVEQAYAAIPHRRTVWVESDSTVPAKEKAYLKVMFQVVDQAVAVRVAGVQNFSKQRFDSADIDGEFDRLISFARTMRVPARLALYHNDILQALSNDRRFFEEWELQRERFAFARQAANHPAVRAAAGALQAAYGELMSEYPDESQTNKKAFFDYHYALDFL